MSKPTDNGEKRHRKGHKISTARSNRKSLVSRMQMEGPTYFTPPVLFSYSEWSQLVLFLEHTKQAFGHLEPSEPGVSCSASQQSSPASLGFETFPSEKLLCHCYSSVIAHCAINLNGLRNASSTSGAQFWGYLRMTDM